MEPKQSPSVGRIVHFLSAVGDTIHREAALIVYVLNEETVNLVVWNTSGSSRPESSVRLGGGSGNWDWPKRV